MQVGEKPTRKPTHSELILAARLNAGLYGVQVAERLGISKQSYSNVERGKSVTLDRLFDIAIAIGCEPSSLDDRLRNDRCPMCEDRRKRAAK